MTAELRDDGWQRHCIWEHSTTVRELYTARARGEAEEMTCAAQASELLAPLITPGDSLLDVGFGLKVHVNAYDADEVETFIAGHGFRVERITDRRSGGRAELVIGHPHWWTFFRAVRIASVAG